MVLLFPPGKKSRVWSPVQSVRRSRDGADGAAALILHGLPPFQLSGDSPPDALQVQASIELARAQGDAERRSQSFRFAGEPQSFSETAPSCPTGVYGCVQTAGQTHSNHNSSQIGTDCRHCFYQVSKWDFCLLHYLRALHLQWRSVVLRRVE